MQLTMLSQLVGQRLSGTEPAYADITFETGFILELGGRRIELHHAGAEHTPGDSFVWLPDAQVIFTGDIAYVGSIPGVMEVSDSATWLDAFGAIEMLDPTYLIPGHGPATTLAQAHADTRNYLQNL